MAESDSGRRRLQKRWLVLSVIVVLALIFLIPFIQEGGARVDTSVEVETRTAELGAITQSVTGSGTVQSAAETKAEAACSGTLASVAVAEGESVRKGDVLAVYDEQSLRDEIAGTMDRLDEMDGEIAELGTDAAFLLTAPSDALVLEVHAGRGDLIPDVMEAYGSLMVLSGDGLLRLELALPEDAVLAEGDAVTLRSETGEAEASVAGLTAPEDGGRTTAVILLEYDGSLQLGETVEVLDGAGETLGTAEAVCNEPLAVTAESGIVSRVAAEPGEWVSEGDELMACTRSETDGTLLGLLTEREALLDTLEDLHELLERPELTAPADGTVTGLSIAAGDTLEAGEQVCTLTAADDFTLTVHVDAKAVPMIEVGQVVTCRFDGLTCTGTVTGTSRRTEMLGGASVSTVTVRLRHVEGISVGDCCEVSIILDYEEEAVLVPVEAVQVEHLDEYFVRVSYGDGLTQLTEVEIGLHDGERVQILSGIRAGDEVVVASRVVETTVFSFFNFEWIIDQEEGESGEETLEEADGVTVMEEDGQQAAPTEPEDG